MIKLLYKVLPCKYNATLGDHLLHNLNRTCLVRLEKRSFQNSSCMWINRDMAATSPSPSSGTTSPNPAPSSSSTDAPKNFYRRVLPETCIAFGSNEGKEVFKEALIKGYMECYFGLAAQFRTQDEPAYCGLSTLVMVLNALEVDPKKIWKGVWRWYHENMLDCCVPLGVVSQTGITFDQFACLAACNMLNVDLTRATPDASVDVFRQHVKSICQASDKVIVASYSRKVLGQTGDGHFSPIGGYHPDRDLVLVLDTARFKYPPHWVPLETLFEAMKSHDKDTGQPRGYYVLGRSKQWPLLLFRIAANLSEDNEGITQFFTLWKEWLKTKNPNTNACLATSPPTLALDSSQDSMCEEAIGKFIQALDFVQEDEYMLTTQMDITCPERLTSEHSCAVEDLICSLEKTTVYEKISDFVSDTQSIEKAGVAGTGLRECSRIAGGAKMPCQVKLSLDARHFLAMLLLAWPYQKCGSVNGHQMARIVTCDMLGKHQALQNEVMQLRQQLELVLNFTAKCSNCQCSG